MFFPPLDIPHNEKKGRKIRTMREDYYIRRVSHESRKIKTCRDIFFNKFINFAHKTGVLLP